MMTNVFPKMVGLPGMLKSLLGVFAFSCLPVAKAGAQSIEDITLEYQPRQSGAGPEA